MSELPTPISDQDKLLSNIAIGTPDIEDLIPNSRQEVYLKYIALNGIHELPVSISQGGTGGTNAEEARRNLDVMHKVSLYANASGTTGTVTLSDSVYNYSYIEIFFRNHNSFYDSIRMAMGSEQKLCNITVHNPQESFLYIDSRTILVEDKSITEVTKIHAGIENQSTYTNTGSAISINRVIGYKF